MRRGPIWVSLATVTAVVGLLTAAPGAEANVTAQGGGGTGGATAVVSGVRIGPDGEVVRTRREVPIRVSAAVTGDKPAEPAPKPAVKLDPRLAAAATDPAGAKGRQRVILTFQEDQKIPRLPDLDPALPRTAPANGQVQAQANTLVSGLAARRQPGYQALRSELARLDIQTLDTYWLIKGMVVDAPVSALPALAQRSDVSYVEPVATGARPPADSDPDNDEADARALMQTDPFFGRRGGYVGILDTGVRSSHTLFNPPRPWIREDLTNATSPNPEDDCWNHGTSTLGILGGNSNLGSDFRGITDLTVDSFKVYPTSRDASGNCNGFLDADAAVRGFQRSVAVLDRVIVAEMQAGGTETSAISTAADSAYDAGAVVIAANGNNGPNPSTVNVPAVAQKVLGIGAVDLKTLTTPSYQSLGPAPDGRTKPDLQAPTNVETASNASDTATQVFTGTSAATPHAAGAAALLRGYLGDAGTTDPGQIYALMIASGNRTSSFDNTHGAGLISLQPQGVFWWSNVTVGNKQVVDIPAVDAAGDGNHPFSVAIWWPEQPATHNDIDVSLVDPNGVVRAQSISVNGIFERLSLAGPVTPGRWTVRITGYSVLTGSQQVKAAWTF